MSVSQEDRLEQATNWFVLSRDSEFSPRQRAEMEAWLEQDSANRQAFAEVCQTWASVDSLRDVYAPQDVTRVSVSKVHLFSWLFPAGGKHSFALTLALLLVLFLPLVPPLFAPAPSLQVQQTRVAEQKTLVLEDGSLLQMNVKTHLAVRMSRTLRRISLEQGEVFFKVAFQPRRPFEVDTPAGVIRVLGTAFNVKARNGKVAVDVKQGRVQVADAFSRRQNTQTGRIVLMANQGIDIGLDGRLGALRSSRIQDVPAWQNGEVAFKNTPVKQVLEELELYHQVTIDLPSAVSNRKISGAFHMRDLEQTLSLICLAATLQIETKSSNYIVLKEAG